MNRVKINGVDDGVRFGQVKAGSMFRYANPVEDGNVYIKSGSRGIMLKNGDDFHIASHVTVCPLAEGTKVQITVGAN
jgi:hypothetical protein